MPDHETPLSSSNPDVPVSEDIIPFTRPAIAGSDDGGVGPLASRAPAPEDVYREKLPSGYVMLPDGIHVASDMRDECVSPVWLCSPFRILAQVRRKDGTAWGKLVEITDSDGNRHEHIVTEADLNNGPAKVLRLLRDCGFKLARHKGAKEQFLDLYDRWIPSLRIELVDKIGWTDLDCSTFVLGNGRIIGDGSYRVAPWLGFGNNGGSPTCGSLDDWTRQVAVPCGGNPMMQLGVALAFTGPLLQMLAMDGGGLHLLGESSHGKSTILAAAASVWSKPFPLPTWSATVGGLEARAALRSDTLMILDELGRADGRVVGDAIYMLANGSGTSRMTPNAMLRPENQWRIALLSSGEVSVEKKMAEARKSIMAGQEIRLLKIVVDQRKFGVFDNIGDAANSHAFTEKFNEAVAGCYGTAGPEFVKRLLAAMAHGDPRGVAGRMMKGFVESCVNEFDLTREGQIARALRRFAVIAVAGEFATKFGITGWSRGEAFSAAKEGFRCWIEEHGHAPRSVIHGTIAQVRSYLHKHGSTRFAAKEDPRVKAGDGWRHEGLFLFTTEAWTVLHGEDGTEAAARLKQAGFLRCGGGKGLQFRGPSWIQGANNRPWTYAVKASILDHIEGLPAMWEASVSPPPALNGGSTDIAMSR